MPKSGRTGEEASSHHDLRDYLLRSNRLSSDLSSKKPIEVLFLNEPQQIHTLLQLFPFAPHCHSARCQALMVGPCGPVGCAWEGFSALAEPASP